MVLFALNFVVCPVVWLCATTLLKSYKCLLNVSLSLRIDASQLFLNSSIYIYIFFVLFFVYCSFIYLYKVVFISFPFNIFCKHTQTIESVNLFLCFLFDSTRFWHLCYWLVVTGVIVVIIIFEVELFLLFNQYFIIN